MRRPRFLALIFGLLLLPTFAAVAAERIEWKSLQPTWDGPVDPFEQLSLDQQDDLADFLWVRDLEQQGEQDEETRAISGAARQRLAGAGLNVDELIAQSDNLEVAWEKHGQKPVPALDGREVRIPGYVLPLEYEGTTVREFLLVPYVGACIHTPPPPPNQIIHVRAAVGLENPEVFMPVWVTGRMSVERSSQNLSLVDGSSDIDVGYGMNAAQVEPYEE